MKKPPAALGDGGPLRRQKARGYLVSPVFSPPAAPSSPADDFFDFFDFLVFFAGAVSVEPVSPVLLPSVWAWAGATNARRPSAANMRLIFFMGSLLVE